jgi:tripeptidyl-peptidase I
MLLTQLAVLAAVANAAPAFVKHVLHEERVSPLSDWVKGDRIEGSAILPVRIGLTQSNLDNGHDFLSRFDRVCKTYFKYYHHAG